MSTRDVGKKRERVRISEKAAKEEEKKRIPMINKF